MSVPLVMQVAFSDLEDLLDASHKLVEESVDSRARSQQASPSVTRDVSHHVRDVMAEHPGKSANGIMLDVFCWVKSLEGVGGQLLDHLHKECKRVCLCMC